MVSASFEIVENGDWTIWTTPSGFGVQGYHRQGSHPVTSSSVPSTLPDSPLPHLFLVQSVRNRTMTMAPFSTDPTENVPPPPSFYKYFSIHSLNRYTGVLQSPWKKTEM